ncbi:hypothetical protein E4P41_00255 [Geodermatophilus sp. DF01-2]|nr:hypothetical protein E4P41_00255 [Geodermatophilus sp. DF01_2]
MAGPGPSREEPALRHVLHAHGARYRLHARDLIGCPDLVNRRKKIAVFVDGDMWHGNPAEPARRGRATFADHFPHPHRLVAGQDRTQQGPRRPGHRLAHPGRLPSPGEHRTRHRHPPRPRRDDRHPRGALRAAGGPARARRHPADSRRRRRSLHPPRTPLQQRAQQLPCRPATGQCPMKAGRRGSDHRQRAGWTAT